MQTLKYCYAPSVGRIVVGVCLSVGLASVYAKDDAPVWVSYSKETPHSASLTLLKMDGKVGRSNPFYNGYRPQLRFVGSKREVTCEVRMPPPQDKVEPGDTAEVVLRCVDDFKVLQKEPFFQVMEGGRKVGEGQLAP